MKVFLVGFMGCGKSYWGKKLSEKLKQPFFDLDEQIEAKEGRPVTQIFTEEGEEYFRKTEKEVLHLITESHDSFIMACGGGTPCFYNTIDYLKQQGVVVWINCSVDCLFTRLVAEKDKRPLIRDLSDDALHSYIVKKFATRKIYYQQAQVVMQNEEVSLDTLVKRIFQQ